MPFFLPYGVGIDGRRGELGMAEPALHQVERNPFLDTGHAKAMPQPFGARLGTGDARPCHHLDDARVGGFQAPGPALRAIMEQVYALFARRCRTQTALDKLATLQRHVQRCPALGDTLKKLFAPTLEKALTLLDDKLLPSTSNAVERGNRRYRKM